MANPGDGVDETLKMLGIALPSAAREPVSTPQKKPTDATPGASPGSEPALGAPPGSVPATPGPHPLQEMWRHNSPAGIILE